MAATGSISDHWLAEVANILKGHLPNPSRSSTTGFPEKVPAITQSFSYTGHLTDMVLISPSIPGVYPLLEDINAAAAFWYSNARVDATQAHELLPRFVVQAGKKRGNLLRRGSDVRLWAFMHAFKTLVENKDDDRITKFKKACTIVNFDVVPTTGDAVTDFFAVWQVLLVVMYMVCGARESHHDNKA